MDTKHIPIIFEIYKCSSINQAAQNLYISQPQVSRTLKNIEEEIGFEIFERSPSGVKVTPKGIILIDSLQVIYTEMEKIERISQNIEIDQSLSIICIYSRLIFEIFLKFKHSRKEESFVDNFQECYFENVIEEILSERARLGVISVSHTDKSDIERLVERYNLELVKISVSLPFLVYMHKNHPLASQKILKPSQLEDQSFVYFRKNRIDDVRKLFGMKKIKLGLQVDDRGTLLDAINSRQYISISNSGSEAFAKGRNHVYIPVEGSKDVSEFYYIKSSRYNLNKREKDFINFLKEELQKIYNPNNK
ncbi:MAG: LysR family transcriptional regulator [Tissierellia bacterium]|nr:LysR family transcriptional regulator [Tissierellia bacterium]